MKNIFENFTEKQIAVFSLLLTAAAVIVGIALPEIRSMMGLDGRVDESEYEVSSMIAQGENDAETARIESDELNLVEITESDTLWSVKQGEFVIYPNVHYVILGAAEGKMTIKTGANVELLGVFKGDVLNEGGKFKVLGVHEGSLKRKQ
ncbi:MAG: hypothetical protein IPJ74_14425 [Saprospiraceae bacterium]|nr:hypothetical protein [Saprospiraceae bacterium]